VLVSESAGAEVEFENVKTAFTEVDGAEVICAVIVSVPSEAVESECVKVIVVAPDRTPARAGAGVPAEIAVMFSFAAALAGATDVINPKPKAETATSAMRLRVVFVDICFLSLVVEKTFSSTAGKERLFAS
jgi:hypothetical protein